MQTSVVSIYSTSSNCLFSYHDVHQCGTYSDDSYTDADPPDDVDFVVEHFVDGSRTALTEEDRKDTVLVLVHKNRIISHSYSNGHFPLVWVH